MILFEISVLFSMRLNPQKTCMCPCTKDLLLTGRAKVQFVDYEMRPSYNRARQYITMHTSSLSLSLSLSLPLFIYLSICLSFSLSVSVSRRN